MPHIYSGKTRDGHGRTSLKLAAFVRSLQVDFGLAEQWSTAVLNLMYIFFVGSPPTDWKWPTHTSGLRQFMRISWLPSDISICSGFWQNKLMVFGCPFNPALENQIENNKCETYETV